MKKLICFMLSAILVLGSVSCVFAREMSDMKTSPYKDAVDTLMSRDVITGYIDGTFRPYNHITRAEACVMITKAMSPGNIKMGGAEKNPFPDMTEAYDWAAINVNYAYAMGIVDGYPDGTFKPANDVTYNELSAMILKALGYTASKLKGTWPDNFRLRAIEMGMYDNIYGLLEEKEIEDFDYDAPATRGDSSFMVVSVLTLLMKQGDEPLPEPGEEEEPEEDNNEPVELTLDRAIYIMQNEGYLADIAKLSKEKDEAVLKGYSDNIKDLKDALEYLDSAYATIMEINAAASQGITRSNLRVATKQKEYAQEYMEANYQADMNSIESNTISLYYGLMQAEENLRACEENLELQQILLKNLRVKLSVGAATPMEVKSQEVTVAGAEDKRNDAETSVKEVEEQFNVLLAFDIDTDLILTDKIEAVKQPKVNLDDAVKSAVDNRLDYVQARYSCDLQSIVVTHLSGSVSKNSATYKEESAKLSLAEANLENMPATIETDVRSKYNAIASKYTAIAAAERTVSLAEDGLRTAQIMYEAGMGIPADVNQAKLSVFQSNQLLMSAIVDYNTAVYEFEYATGVGKTRVSF